MPTVIRVPCGSFFFDRNETPQQGGKMKISRKSREIHKVTIGDGPVLLPGIIAVARRGVPVVISKGVAFGKRMETSRKLLHTAMEAGIPVYGVTTGFGKSCGNRLNKRTVLKQGVNLMRFHGCGTGEPLACEETRAAMLCRLLCLARGYSGVSLSLLEHLAAFLNLGITPVIPSEGSVGASGDLTPLSYVLAALAGERGPASGVRAGTACAPRFGAGLSFWGWAGKRRPRGICC